MNEKKKEMKNIIDSNNNNNDKCFPVDFNNFVYSISLMCISFSSCVNSIKWWDADVTTYH